MRLTLRTLLSYLDDTLEPAQAKAIGAKVAESEQARDLVERIKQVTRRRRLTTPPSAGPGGIDGNTIAEYLDNEVTLSKPRRSSRFAWRPMHRGSGRMPPVLTLVLASRPCAPSAKQRMYGNRQAQVDPFRKPASPAPDISISSDVDADHDDTLRMGVLRSAATRAQENCGCSSAPARPRFVSSPSPCGC